MACVRLGEEETLALSLSKGTEPKDQRSSRDGHFDKLNVLGTGRFDKLSVLVGVP